MYMYMYVLLHKALACKPWQKNCSIKLIFQRKSVQLSGGIHVQFYRGYSRSNHCIIISLCSYTYLATTMRWFVTLEVSLWRLLFTSSVSFWITSHHRTSPDVSNSNRSRPPTPPSGQHLASCKNREWGTCSAVSYHDYIRMKWESPITNMYTYVIGFEKRGTCNFAQKYFLQ